MPGDPSSVLASSDVSVPVNVLHFGIQTSHRHRKSTAKPRQAAPGPPTTAATASSATTAAAAAAAGASRALDLMFGARQRGSNRLKSTVASQRSMQFSKEACWLYVKMQALEKLTCTTQWIPFCQKTSPDRQLNTPLRRENPPSSNMVALHGPMVELQYIFLLRTLIRCDIPYYHA